MENVTNLPYWPCECNKDGLPAEISVSISECANLYSQIVL